MKTGEDKRKVVKKVNGMMRKRRKARGVEGEGENKRREEEEPKGNGMGQSDVAQTQAKSRRKRKGAVWGLFSRRADGRRRRGPILGRPEGGRQ